MLLAKNHCKYFLFIFLGWGRGGGDDNTAQTVILLL